MNALDEIGASKARPFVGLRPFTFADRDFFFGRDQQIDALEQKIAHSRLLSVVGSSGSGKSSLIRAGLLPRLTESPATGGMGWSRAEMRPGEAPIRQLAEALADLDRPGDAMSSDPATEARADRIELALRDSTFGIREALPLLRGLGDKTLIILVDQFEEVFRFADLRAQETHDPARASELRDEATFFVQLLLTAADDEDFPGRIVLTMRSDFIGDCARFHGLSEAVTASQYLVPALTRDQRAVAIRAPVEFAGGEIEPALVQQVLNDTNEDPDQLPVLQHAMMRCWQQAVAGPRSEHEPPRMTRQHYAAVGGVSRALSIHANLVLQGLAMDSARAARARLPLDLIAKRIFQSLTDTDSHGRTTRRPQKFADLVAVLVSDSAEPAARAAVEEAVRHVVLQFADPGCSFLRGIQESDLAGASVIDIGHEALIRRWDRLGGLGETNWVREEQVDGETFGDLLSLARTKSVVPQEELLRLEKWWAERRPTAFWAKRYVKAGTGGIKDAESVLARSRRARRYKIGIVALIVLLLAISTVIYVIDTKHARDAARAQAQAGARLLSALGSEALLREGPEKGLLYATYGLDEKNVPFIPEMEGLAYKALQQLREKQIISVFQPIYSLAFMADGSIVGLINQTTLRFWDPSTGKQVRDDIELKRREFIVSVSPDGKRIIASGIDGAVIENLSDGSETPLGGSDPAAKAGLAAISPDGRYILTFAIGDTSPKLWDVAVPAKPLADFALTLPYIANATAGAFSAPSKYFALGGRDGKIHIYDAASRNWFKTLPDCLAQRTSGTTPVNRQVYSLAFDPVDPNVLLATQQGATCWFDIAAGKVTQLPMQSDSDKASSPNAVTFYRGAFAADGSRIAIGSNDGLIRLWDRWNDLQGYSLSLLRGSQGNIFSLAFSPKDPNLVASVSQQDQTIRIWDIHSALTRGLTAAKADMIATQSPPAAEADLVAASNGISLHRAASQDEFTIESQVAGIPSGPLLLPSDHSAIQAAAFSADGSWLALAPRAGRIFLFDLKRFNGPIAVLGGADVGWSAIGFAENPDRIIATLPDGSARAWRYFKSLPALIDYANASLPLRDGEKVTLAPEDLCKLHGQTNILPIASTGQEIGKECE